MKFALKQDAIKILLPLGILTLGFLIYGLLIALQPEPEKKDRPPRALSVFVEPVVQADIPLKVTTQGEVRARTQVDIIAQVAGRVVEVSPEFVEGGVITPEVPLVVIEPTDYEFALSQAEARVAEAEVRVQQAEADANVARQQLRGEKDVSALALKQPQLAEARARLKAAQADLAQAKLNLERTRISLPFHGRVLTTSVDIGQFVSPGTRIGRAFGQELVEIRLPLTDSQLASLGLPIGFVAEAGQGLPVAVSARVAGRQHHWQGSLVRLDAAVDTASRMVFGLAEVRAPYAEGASAAGMPLAVGLFVNAEITGRQLQGAYIIPRQALRAGNQVYVLNDDSKLEIRQVEVTWSSADEAVIGSGLNVDDQVIVSAIRNAIAGMPLEALKPAVEEDATLAESIKPEENPKSEGG